MQLIMGIISCLCPTEIREWIDGWMDRAVKSVCKTLFEKQKRGLRLDIFFQVAGRVECFV